MDMIGVYSKVAPRRCSTESVWLNSSGCYVKTRNAPTASHFQSRQFFAVDHSSYCPGRQIQQFSSLLRSQKWRRVGLLVHRQCSLETRVFSGLLDGRCLLPERLFFSWIDKVPNDFLGLDRNVSQGFGGIMRQEVRLSF